MKDFRDYDSDSDMILAALDELLDQGPDPKEDSTLGQPEDWLVVIDEGSWRMGVLDAIGVITGLTYREDLGRPKP
jgi:hypothetical protein